MRFVFLTAYPSFVQSICHEGLLGRVAKLGIAQYSVIDLRDYGVDERGTVDDRPYGGGEGMILRPEPVAQALATIAGPKKVILPSPAGSPWHHSKACEAAQSQEIDPSTSLVFLCPRFGGVDQRAIDLFVDEEVSLGDFIVSNGEMAACMITDTIVRLLPGALGDPKSAELDSFSESYSGQLEAEQFTRPQVFNGKSVPAALLSGNHEAIRKWREENSKSRTQQRRPDLIRP